MIDCLAFKAVSLHPSLTLNSFSFSQFLSLSPRLTPRLTICPKRSISSVKSKYADCCALFISMKIETALLKAALTLPLSQLFS